MALNLKSTITEGTSCKSFVILDTTGTYSAFTNPGGWGAPNIATTDVVTATLEVTLMGYSAEATTLDITANFADLFTANGLTVTASQLFNSTTFSDGYYQIVYKVTTATTYYEYYNYQVFLCSSKCCVSKQTTNIKLPVTNYQLVEDVFLQNILLIGAGWAACCGQSDNAATIIEYLKLLCAGCGESQVKTFGSIESSSNTGCCS